MSTYRVSLSDRKRDRIVDAYGPTDAIREAVGARFRHCREDSRAGDGGFPLVFEAAVATGATRNGATPFRNIRAYVYLEAE